LGYYKASSKIYVFVVAALITLSSSACAESWVAYTEPTDKGLQWSFDRDYSFRDTASGRLVVMTAIGKVGATPRMGPSAPGAADGVGFVYALDCKARNLIIMGSYSPNKPIGIADEWRNMSPKKADEEADQILIKIACSKEIPENFVLARTDIPRYRNNNDKTEVQSEISGLAANETEPNNYDYHEMCVSFGFKKDTNPFSNCLLQLKIAHIESEDHQKRYQLDLLSYNQNLRYLRQKEEDNIRRRNRDMWAVIARLGFGIAGSRSPSFEGALADGFEAASGLPINSPPTPPTLPAIQNYSIRTANGSYVNCSYNNLNRIINCN
jgi:hypothetical protein